jgi:hypothetical protein
MEDLRNVIKKNIFLSDFEKIWNKPFSGNKGLNKFETYCLYCFIRVYKPKKIKEMSPNDGFSTYIMCNAIIDENFSEEIVFFHSYDIQNTFCSEAITEYGKIKNFQFFLGDAKTTLSINENIDFFFIDSNHSKIFAKWYLQFLNYPNFIFVHDINPSAEYSTKFRSSDLENVYSGGEPFVVYDFLKYKGYKQKENKVYLPKEFVSNNESGFYNMEWECEKDLDCKNIFWSLNEQIKFLFNDSNQYRENFLLEKSNYTLRNPEVLFGPSQSLFIKNI